MRKIIHKLFFAWNFDEEEKWLNDMSQKGWHLVSVSFCRYEFEQGEPGEYTIRLEMIDDMPSSSKGKDYLTFLEEIGVEYIGSVSRWIYVRKKTSDEKFELFSDNKSRIKHLNGILTLLLIATIPNLYFGIYNCSRWLFDGSTGHSFGILNLLLSILCGYGCIKILNKKHELTKNNKIFE